MNTHIARSYKKKSVVIAPNVSSISYSMFKISLGICREGHDVSNENLKLGLSV